MSGLDQQFVQETFASNCIAPVDPQAEAFEDDPATDAGQCSLWASMRPALAFSSGAAAP